MKQMVVYEVTAGGETWFCATTKEASQRTLIFAQTLPKDEAAEVWVNFIRTDLRKRNLHAALLNRAMWCEGRDLVQTDGRQPYVPLVGDKMSSHSSTV